MIAIVLSFLAKHWKVTALVMAVGVPSGLAWYWHTLYTHERSAWAGERKAIADETAKAKADNDKRVSDAKTEIDGLRVQLNAVVPPDPRGPLVLRVCPARQVSAVPKDASPSQGGDAGVRPPATVAGRDEGRDIVPPTEAILTEARNRILYLQRYIAAGQHGGFIDK